MKANLKKVFGDNGIRYKCCHLVELSEYNEEFFFLNSKIFATFWQSENTQVASLHQFVSR